MRFLDVYKKHRVKFIWIKGHSNITENERCDQLAVEASQELNKNDDIGYTANN